MKRRHQSPSTLVALRGVEDLKTVVNGTGLRLGAGLTLAQLVATPAVRNLIREAKVPQMYSAIQTGQNIGMQTLDQCLLDLLKRGIVSKQEAASKAANKDSFQ